MSSDNHHLLCLRSRDLSSPRLKTRLTGGRAPSVCEWSHRAHNRVSSVGGVPGEKKPFSENQDTGTYFLALTLANCIDGGSDAPSLACFPLREMGTWDLTCGFLQGWCCPLLPSRGVWVFLRLSLEGLSDCGGEVVQCKGVPWRAKLCPTSAPGAAPSRSPESVAVYGLFQL